MKKPQAARYKCPILNLPTEKRIGRRFSVFVKPKHAFIYLPRERTDVQRTNIAVLEITVDKKLSENELISCEPRTGFKVNELMVTVLFATIAIQEGVELRCWRILRSETFRALISGV